VCGTHNNLKVIALAALVLFAGCSAQQPEFRERDETADLIPPAQTYVRDYLNENFGTPTDMVAWERLPVRYHAAVATVGENPGDDEFTLNISEQSLPIEPGDELFWYSGDPPNQVSGVVTEYDPETQTVSVGGDPAHAPSAGDRLAIAPGKVMQHGRVLYAEHCQHCHGVTGDGAGPTSEYLNPLPRDYRAGLFKFTSTNSTRRAQRTDLAHIIEDGIPGTYMPSFKLLTPDESNAIVEYVLWLSMRGETELKVVGLLGFDFSVEAVGEDTPEEYEQDFQDQLDTLQLDTDDVISQIANDWTIAQAEESLVIPSIPRPPSSPESIASGREVYLSANAKCATCHGEAGLGNGEQTLLVQQGQTEPGLFDNWGHEIQPRNLTSGIYRGGRRPIDIYRRIHSWIKGTPMTGFGTALSDEQIWDLVNYVLSVPYEERAPGDGGFVPSEPASTQQVAATESASPSATDNGSLTTDN
jgi:mono/diheme cytochrome c family protein